MQILQFSTKGMVQNIIKFRTWGRVSHTAALLTDQNVIEAWHKPLFTGEVRLMSLEERLTHLDNGEFIDFFDVTVPHDINRVENFLRKQIGKPYDFSAIYNFISRKNKNNFNKWFCSELVFASFANNGILLLNCPQHKVSPAMIEYSPYLRWRKRAIKEEGEIRYMMKAPA